MLLQSRLSASILSALLTMVAATSARADVNDPPGRAARLSYTQGATSFSPAGETDWVDTVVNRPLVSGDRLWADSNGRAEVEIGSSALRLNANTNFELVNLDDRMTQVEVTQGTLYVHLRNLSQDQNFEVDTPTLAVTLTQAGQYRIEVDPDGQHTTVAVTRGGAEAYGDNAEYPLQAGDRVRFHAADLRDAEQLNATMPPDDFDRFSASRDARAEHGASLQYVGSDVVGADDLDEYGSWSAQQDYGHVWYPSHVAANWAPYSDGHWIWQDPWGWTWVDNAPWGFAPAHYGRWVSIDNRWGWVPGPRGDHAVYAPALVAFIGGVGFSASISTGGAGPIGWFPLGARDIYEPPYTASRSYFTRVNVTNTTINNTNITNVYNNYSSGRPLAQASYANRTISGAVTAVPGNVFVSAQPVRAAAVKVDSKVLASAEVMRMAAVAPSARSVIGNTSAARVQPTSAVIERKVVARTAPPPNPIPFAARQQELQHTPGLPLTPSAVAALQPRTTTANAERNLRVLGPQTSVVNARTAGPARAESVVGPKGPPQAGAASQPPNASVTDQRQTVQSPQEKPHKGPPIVQQNEVAPAQVPRNAQSSPEPNRHVPSPPQNPQGAAPSADQKRDLPATSEQQKNASPPSGPQPHIASPPQSEQAASPTVERKRNVPSPTEQQQNASPPSGPQPHVASPLQPEQAAPPTVERKRNVRSPAEQQQNASPPSGPQPHVASPLQPEQAASPTVERKSNVRSPAEQQQNASPPAGQQQRLASPPQPQQQDGAQSPAQKHERSSPPPPHDAQQAPEPKQNVPSPPQQRNRAAAPEPQRDGKPSSQPQRNAPPAPDQRPNAPQHEGAPAPQNTGKGTNQKDQNKDATNNKDSKKDKDSGGNPDGK